MKALPSSRQPSSGVGGHTAGERLGERTVLADAAFCVSMLPRVSRTFALSIEALPRHLADPVRVAYLLCRIVDTIEDEATLAPLMRERLFDLFEQVIEHEPCDPLRLEHLSRESGIGGAGPDGVLCRQAAAVVRQLRLLPAAQRRAIVPRVVEMTSGMREYARRRDADGEFRIADFTDLERYCYFVAGTVGLLLTELFLHSLPGIDAELREDLRARAVPFGIGLQLVNIVKDVAKDAERGVCFVPCELATELGVPRDRLLDPSYRDAGLELVRTLARHAHGHLEQAAAYTLLWPLPEGAQQRLFCAVPLLLAQATLDQVSSGEDALRPGRSPKITRDQVADILLRAQEASRCDEALRAMLWERA